ncbi:hypothetical protein BS50DRAFT_5640 [Corynespora cassiicola Philippines]|uniref:SET domain-containing protein n=1 Tax=Corynespora cassiicola Philippines TaxID=1448308 RepID=A0A2T2P9G0_CORCC|nr:hypothetical protein BS50DRAFT_5640 [Corynespora cassiicola Philippines]
MPSSMARPTSASSAHSDTGASGYTDVATVRSNSAQMANSSHAPQMSSSDSSAHMPECAVTSLNYEIKPIETKNTFMGYTNVSQGLFAAKDLPPGTCIATEYPIMEIPPPSKSANQMVWKFEAMSPEKQQEYMTLIPHMTPQTRPIAHLIERVVEAIMPILNKSKAGRTAQENAVLQLLCPNLGYLIKGWRIASRYFPYRVALGVETLLDHDKNKDATEILPTSLLALSSRLQHSCVPNSTMTTNDDEGTVSIYVVKPIKKGAAITSSSLGANTWFHVRADRAQQLAMIQGPGWSCICEACDETKPGWAKQEQLRSELAAAAKTVTSFLERHSRGETATGEELEAERQVLNLIAGLRKAGCEDQELIRWRSVLVTFILPNIPGKGLAALAHAKTNYVVGVRCWGLNHPQLKTLDAAIEHCKGVMAKGW